ncbi:MULTISPECIES: hypothetical protein [Sphingobacterium]|nr:MULTISPECIES: hypothetical protein [Sphingobacterium]OJZ05659.1 MAG: hypothetical protein BGP15_12580 [Sphingobacterium sp. 40-24]
MSKIIIGFISLSALLFTACGQAGSNKDEAEQHHSQATPESHGHSTQMGELVPSDEVCMVNDAYMGKKQFDVKFGGKTYYGCCEMCKERIPNDASVRMAIDPYSHKQVDKALAVIAVTGNNGEVSYFESRDNYTNYLKKQKQ